MNVFKNRVGNIENVLQPILSPQRFFDQRRLPAGNAPRLESRER